MINVQHTLDILDGLSIKCANQKRYMECLR